MSRFFIIIIGIFLISCSEVNNPQPKEPKNKEYSKYLQNYRLWQKQNIKNYSFKVKKDCSCKKTPLTKVIVKDRFVKKAINLETKKPIKNIEGVNSIDDYFVVINKSLQKNFNIKVNYNLKYHYPQKIIIDDNNTLIIKDFRILK